MFPQRNLHVSLFAIIPLTLAAAHAADDPPRRPADKNPNGLLEQMDRTLQLTDDQKTKLKPLIDSMNQELDDLRQDSIARIRESLQAAPGKPFQKYQQENDDIKKANDDFQKLLNLHLAKINAVLTHDQRITWETAKLNRMLMGRFGWLDLTDAQRQQLQPLIDAAGKEIADAKDPAAADAATGKVIKKIVAEILTEEQTGKLFSPPTINTNVINAGRAP